MFTIRKTADVFSKTKKKIRSKVCNGENLLCALEDLLEEQLNRA
jgi:hypothetical protein